MSPSSPWRLAVHRLLHNPTKRDLPTIWVNRLIAMLIVGNVLALALETVPAVYRGNEAWFKLFETGSIAVFFVEYLLRLWSCVEQPEFAHPVWGRLRWMTKLVPLFDLVVLVTFFAPVDLRFLRLARFLRLLQVLNLEGLAHTYDALKSSIRAREELLWVTATLMFIALFSSASLLYMFEHEAQPNVFSSVPATLWWSVVTLATIGYGDMVPITAGGKVCAALTAIFGVAVFALPGAILTAAIIDADGRTKVCPHCGKGLH